MSVNSAAVRQPSISAVPTTRLPRHLDIDHMKCLFTIVMIYGHAWILLANTLSGTWYNGFILIARPGVFSGFLFCFGFAVWLSYFERPVFPWKKMLRSAWKCYLAYVISGCAYQFLVHGKNPDLHLLLRVSALLEIPGMSEFLLAFALMIIVSAALPQTIRFFTRTRLHFAVAAVACLLLTYFKASEGSIPAVGLFVNQKGSDCFPVLSYLPLFLLGSFFARHKVKFHWTHAIVASVGVGVFVVMSCWWPWPHFRPYRFPPNATWILGSACITYLSFGIGKLACKLPVQVQRFSSSIGQNVLFYLTVSNLGIFACAALARRITLNHGTLVLAAAALIWGIFFLQYIVVDYARVGQILSQQSPALRAEKG